MGIADEVTSLVIDIGSQVIRVGVSGEETPLVVLPSFVGQCRSSSMLFGNLNLSHPREDMTIESIMSANDVANWEALEELLKHAVESMLKMKWEEYPLLLVDNPFWSKETREKLLELFFNKLSVPAIFLGRSPVVGAFALGKHSAIVIDLGASALRVCPIYEGMLVKNAVVQSESLGGKHLSNQCKELLAKEKIINSPIIISQQVKSKRPVDMQKPADFDVKELKGVTDSFIHYNQQIVWDDFKEAVIQISEIPYNEEELSKRPPKYYEFPNGFNSTFVLERFKLGEILFNPSQFLIQEGEKDTIIGLAEMIEKCLELCDNEIKSSILSNIVLTGGGSCIAGLAERLHYELAIMPLFSRARIHIAPSSAERKSGIWTGGSILSSLGNFQNLWITKDEYKEHDPSIVEKKCL